MTIEEQIMKLQTYKMYEGEDTVYVERDDVLKALEQEPCEDWISRQDTIDAIYKKHIGGKDAIENAQINDLYACGLEEAVDAVENMPSVTPQQTRWIPVSERLPESSGVYIVSRWFSDGCESKILTSACYFDGTNTWHNDIGINHSRDYVNEKIVAWMPLPEPYREERTEE